ncbi:MAG: ribonuclease HI [Planctomycetes bacterium]|nr:ribonuclease HI [Planctomycetota bacterium]
MSIYTDGGCRGNPGCGAWAAILVAGKHRRTLGGAAAHTTNNQMELQAAIEGFQALKRPCQVRFVSDSEYLIKGMTQWIQGWQRRGWKTSSKDPVKNRPLWQAMAKLTAHHRVRWEWVRGHDGHPENEECDRIVNDLMDRLAAGEPVGSLRVDERRTGD